MHPEIERLIKEREDLGPMLRFFGLLLEKQESSRPDNLLPLVDLSKNSIKGRLEDGSSLCDPSKTDLLDLENSIGLFYKILELAKDAPDHIKHQAEAAARVDRSDAEGAMKAILSGNEEDLRRLAERSGLSGEFLFFMSGLSLAPSLRFLSSKVQENLDMLWWNEPFFPLCGESPAMASEEGDGRWLYCSFCGMEWIYRGSGCLLCDTENEKMIGAIRIRDEDGYYLSVCGNCNGYIKMIDREKILKGLDIRIIELVSLPLDIIARQKGYKGSSGFPI